MTKFLIRNLPFCALGVSLGLLDMPPWGWAFWVVVLPVAIAEDIREKATR